MGCVLAEPIVSGLEKDLEGQLTVLRIDIYTPAGRELSGLLSARSTPTFILLDDSGQEIFRSIGTVDGNRIRTLVTD